MLIDLLTGIGQSRFLVTDRDCHLLVGLSELSAAVVLATTPSSARTASCGSTRSAVASATIRLMADPNYVPRCNSKVQPMDSRAVTEMDARDM